MTKKFFPNTFPIPYYRNSLHLKTPPFCAINQRLLVTFTYVSEQPVSPILSVKPKFLEKFQISRPYMVAVIGFSETPVRSYHFAPHNKHHGA